MKNPGQASLSQLQSAVVLLTAIFRRATCTVLSIGGASVKPRGQLFSSVDFCIDNFVESRSGDLWFSLTA